MTKINFLKPDISNLNTFLYIGTFLFFLSILDVFLNSFFQINLTGFLPSKISFVLPIIIGFIGLFFIRIEQSGFKFLDSLNKNQILKLVVMPQALRIIIPPTTNQYLNLTKNSSLAAAIAYPDIVLVFAGTALMQTGKAIEIVFITMFTYLTLSITISLFMNWYNKKIAIQEK